MKQQKYYLFFQQQILMMVGLSVTAGIVYVFAGWKFGMLMPALVWYGLMLLNSLYGWKLYKELKYHKMDEETLLKWYDGLKIFMYLFFGLWSVLFIMYVGESESDLHYIVIFTQLGASVVASALLVSDKKMFIPILFTMILLLAGYFFLIGEWYGYILSVFSLILLVVLLYASYNTYSLLQKNYEQAQHDALTGLYNRRYFIEYMDSLIARLRMTQEAAYIFLIDLDNFKAINDSLGHEIGDELLIAVSERIKLFSQNTHILARLGGDEFVLISKNIKKENGDKEAAYSFALHLLDIIREPYMINQHYLYITASIGVHKIQPQDGDSDCLLKNVDIAMYDAKSKGRDTVIMFDKSLSLKIDEHLIIEQKLHQALKEGWIDVYYQPQIDANKHIIGCEALVRWTDKNFGTIAPDVFIPIAEKTGLIVELGSYILNETFKTLHEWDEKGIAPKNFSINISIKQFLHHSFVEEVDSLRRKYPIQSTRQKIIFEITESIFAHDIYKMVAIMNRLKDIGISFSIDDFGTGYSSLSYLKELPVSELKVDKSFVSDYCKSESDKNMIKTIIAIAKNFDLCIVAEGIETQEQFDFFVSHGCDLYQGYYFDKAITKSEFEDKYLLA